MYPDEWKGTEVHPKKGRVLANAKYTIPYGMLDLIKEKAAHVDKVRERLSVSQRTKIDGEAMANIDKEIGSDQLAAIMADAERFGIQAVLNPHSEDGAN